MNWKREVKIFLLLAAVFVACWFVPVGWGRFDSAVDEALYLVQDYARKHVLLCLVPAFFIAGAIASFISKASISRSEPHNEQEMSPF